jgi:hypothetical protein
LKTGRGEPSGILQTEKELVETDRPFFISSFHFYWSTPAFVLILAVKIRKSSIFTAGFHRVLALSAEKTAEFAICSAAVTRIGIKNGEISGFFMLFSARMAVKIEKEGTFTAAARPARDSSAVSI